MFEYKKPDGWESEFTCPHCGVYSQQNWSYSTRGFPSRADVRIEGLEYYFCQRCKGMSIWLNQKMIYPEIIPIVKPNDDLEEEIKDDYIEAANIAFKSPRAAAALLRLCVQKLCIQLGESSGNLNDDIAHLVKKGMNVQIQQSLDIVRVIGNEAIHPGELDLRDDLDTALELFKLINLIADSMITQPKRIASVYESLPEAKRKAIEKRDK